jgi:hypothetical protein
MEIALVLLVLHGPDGREIDVSVNEITSLQCKMPKIENRLFHSGVNSIVNTSDGKFVSVVETCTQIRELIEKSERGEQ